MRTTLLTMALGAVLGIAAPVAAAHGAPPSTLAGRIAPPAAHVIETFERAGMLAVRPHPLTPSELTKVEAALAALPALHRRVLDTRLRRLSFVDGMPGHGSALAARVGDTGQFDITLRASLLHESLAEFLTTKERRLFQADGSGHTIAFDAGGAGALAYILLHETTHVVDAALGLTARPHGVFTRGIWAQGEGKAPNALAPQWAVSPAAASRFRGAGLMPAGRAQLQYDALADTPFVSLYATAAAAEDLAELVAWHVVATRHGARITLSVRDADGALVKQYEPLRFPAVQARVRLVEALLAEAERGAMPGAGPS